MQGESRLSSNGILSGVSDAVGVFESKANDVSLVTLTEVRKDDKPIMAAVHLGIGGSINKLASVYPRSGDLGAWINSSTDASDVTYINKEKSQALNSINSALQLRLEKLEKDTRLSNIRYSQKTILSSLRAKTI